MVLAKGWMVNLGLLVALLGGGTFLWWTDKQDIEHKAADEAIRKVCIFKPAEVTHLTFRGKEGGEVTLRKADKLWRIVVPRAMRTNQPAVERLTTILNLAYDRKVVDKPEDLVAFGLDQPAATLTATAEDGRSQTLLLGGNAPTGNQRYLRLGQDGPVVLLAETKINALLQGVDDLRDKRLFADLEAAKVQTVEIRRGDEILRLGHDEQSRWRIEQPKADMASDGRVNAWLNMVIATTGSGFSEVVPTTPPTWTILFTSAGGVQQEVWVWLEEKRIVAQRQGDIDTLILYGHLIKDFNKPYAELAALQPIGTGDPPPTELTVIQGAKQAKAAKKDGKWPLPAWSSLEEALTGEAWQGKPSLTEIPPGVTIVVGEGEQARSYPLWKDDEFYHLAPPGRPVILQLSRLQTDALDAALKVIFPAEGAPPAPPVIPGQAADNAAAPN